MKTTYKVLSFVTFSFFVLVGTYNSVVINSESHITGTEVKFVKRLDELYGVTVPGREVAASVSWKKIAPVAQKPVHQKYVAQEVKSVAASAIQEEVATPVETVAAVQEELSLSLVEVINEKKWKNGLTAGQFDGTLSTNQGVIESLSVSLPNGEGVSVSFSEMTGNVFEYDINGELYSGMMYQVDQHAYMVTLTNGPLEGTRLRFSNVQAQQEQQEQNQEYLAENNIDVGQFGNNDSYDSQQAYDIEQAALNATPEVQTEVATDVVTEGLNIDEQLQQQALQANVANQENGYAM